MPELPELEVVCEVLVHRVVGQTIGNVEVIPPGGPIVVRDLIHAGFESTLAGATIASVTRQGKFLIFSLTKPGDAFFLALNPKLTGRLQLASALNGFQGGTPEVGAKHT